MRISVSLLIIPFLAFPAAGKSSGIIISWTDGDSANVRIAGGRVRVRLIGIDAPEVASGARGSELASRLGVSRQDLQRLARAATAAANRLAPPDMRVVLETDVQTHDWYGRLLAYLWLPDGLMANEQMLRRGYAMLLTIPPNVRYVDRFRLAQQVARNEGRGLWVSPAPPRSTRGAQNCDPAYPAVCIPPPPPDLDCGDIPYRNFTVLPPDPHRFDRDRDGVGCEGR